MKAVLAKVYENIGRPRTAVELYEQAVALEREQSPRRPLREAAALSRLAVVLANDHPGHARRGRSARSRWRCASQRLPARRAGDERFAQLAGPGVGHERCL
jgi:hypothetical protein